MIEVTIKFDPPAGGHGDNLHVTQTQRFCYEPHLDRHDHGLPNLKYQPHVHISSTDNVGRPVAVIWEGS